MIVVQHCIYLCLNNSIDMYIVRNLFSIFHDAAGAESPIQLNNCAVLLILNCLAVLIIYSLICLCPLPITPNPGLASVNLLHLF